jgi:hypothetical protein
VRKRGLTLIYPTINTFIGDDVGDYASGDEDQYGDGYDDRENMDMDKAPTLSAKPWVPSFGAGRSSFTPALGSATASGTAQPVAPSEFEGLTSDIGDMGLLPRPKEWDSMDMS